MKKNKFRPDQFKQNNSLVLVGKKTILDAVMNVHTAHQIQQIIVAKNQVHLMQVLAQHNVSYMIQDKAWFNRQFPKINHQFCCIYFRIQPHINLEQLIAKTKGQPHGTILVLDQIQDPHNFGAILRTAAAVNIAGVIILNKNQVQLNTTVLKVSQGLGLLVDVVVVNNLSQALQKLKDNGFWVYATTMSTKSVDYNQVTYAPYSVVIVGNEGNGISTQLVQNADFHILIPMHSSVESLNVSVATGLVLYQIYLQHQD